MRVCQKKKQLLVAKKIEQLLSNIEIVDRRPEVVEVVEVIEVVDKR